MPTTYAQHLSNRSSFIPENGTNRKPKRVLFVTGIYYGIYYGILSILWNIHGVRYLFRGPPSGIVFDHGTHSMCSWVSQATISLG